MKRKSDLILQFALLLSVYWLGCPAFAANTFAVDGLHGDVRFEQFSSSINLDSLYPDMHFTTLNVRRLPVYNVLAAGVCSDDYDSAAFTVPESVSALYVILDGPLVEHLNYWGQFPYIGVTGPDQSVTRGGYGFVHIDDPAPGQYMLHMSFMGGGENAQYLIGTGPKIWDVYPPEDYDAVLDFHTPTWELFTGRPSDRSAADSIRLHSYLNSGGGIGLFYDGAEPIALKPIIRLSNYPIGTVSVRLDLPAITTYAKPEPLSRNPLVWNMPNASSDVELDYEARYNHNLNFVWCAPGSDEVINNSWATAHDVKLLEFVPNQGYRVNEVGTLTPGAKAVLHRGVAKDFGTTFQELDRVLRKEALDAGMSAEESASFFSKYSWAMRVLGRSGQEPGMVALYRIEGSDYDALFPLTTSPLPAERTRVLWVDSYLPARVTAPAAIHSKLIVPEPEHGTQGIYHEYGFFKETYGGDALDDMDQWGWHFYDQMLIDCTNVWNNEEMGSFYFTRWSNSIIANALGQNVPQVYGRITGGISAQHPADILLTGDEDCYSEDTTTFPQGSFPAVLVGAMPTSGGKLVGAGDFAFLDSIGNNLRLGRNIFNWLHRSATENVPDIDIPDAVIFAALTINGSATTTAYIHNIGSAALTLTTTLPTASWLSVSGPTTTTLAAGDSQVYTFNWNRNGLADGFYQTWWDIFSNDPNEDTLHWPVLLRVGSPSAIGPKPKTPIATQFDLLPPFPNPFNPATTLTFELAAPGKVTLELCNVLGERVATLCNNIWAAGKHELRVDLSSRSSGIYFVRGQSGGNVVVRKLVLLK